MARRHQQHEEHLNHEAWAIPYGDLVTLLLAFFVVMYAVSSVNEGKYRVLADAMAAAFGGTPRTIAPIQLGHQQLRGSAFDRPSIATPGAAGTPARRLAVGGAVTEIALSQGVERRLGEPLSGASNTARLQQRM